MKNADMQLAPFRAIGSGRLLAWPPNLDAAADRIGQFLDQAETRWNKKACH
jgi:hypothetical protein